MYFLRVELTREQLGLMALAVLADGRQYGYAVGRRLRQVAGRPIPAGTLYPLLHDLAARGLIVAERERDVARPRVWYELTDAGRAAFRRDVVAWQASLAKLEALILPAMRRVGARASETPR